MQIEFTPALRDELRAAYDKAVEQGAEEFTFKGEPLWTDYAKYVLEYLDYKLPHPEERTP